jgi:hypothetical protein
VLEIMVIVIGVLGVAVLLGWPLWFVFIAREQEEHINPDISEAESSGAWGLDMKEKCTRKRQRKKLER